MLNVFYRLAAPYDELWHRAALRQDGFVVGLSICDFDLNIVSGIKQCVQEDAIETMFATPPLLVGVFQSGAVMRG